MPLYSHPHSRLLFFNWPLPVTHRGREHHPRSTVAEATWTSHHWLCFVDNALQLFGPVHIPACRRSFLPESGFGPTTEVIHPNPWYLCFIPINPYPQPDPFFPSRYNPTNYLFTPSLGSSSSSLWSHFLGTTLAPTSTQHHSSYSPIAKHKPSEC